MISVYDNNQHNSVSFVYYMNLVIVKVAYGAKVIWEKITSCFGSGIWNSDKPWIETEIWKNN